MPRLFLIWLASVSIVACVCRRVARYRASIRHDPCDGFAIGVRVEHSKMDLSTRLQCLRGFFFTLTLSLIFYVHDHPLWITLYGAIALLGLVLWRITHKALCLETAILDPTHLCVVIAFILGIVTIALGSFFLFNPLMEWGVLDRFPRIGTLLGVVVALLMLGGSLGLFLWLYYRGYVLTLSAYFLHYHNGLMNLVERFTGRNIASIDFDQPYECEIAYKKARFGAGTYLLPRKILVFIFKQGHCALVLRDRAIENYGTVFFQPTGLLIPNLPEARLFREAKNVYLLFDLPWNRKNLYMIIKQHTF